MLLCFSCLFFEFLFPSELIKSPNCFLLTFLEPEVIVAKGIANFFITLGRKRGVSPFLASTSLKGEGGLDLFCGLNIARGRGGLILPVLGVYARGETYSGCPQRCLNTWDKSRALGPTPMERPIHSAESSMGCLKRPGNLALTSLCLVPMPEEGPTTSAPYRPQGV